MSIQTCSNKTQEMQDYILQEIVNLKQTPSFDQYGNIYVIKTDDKNTDKPYPTMVCHIDTVHEINNNVKVFEDDDVMFAMDMLDVTQYGIGGDDKVGIFITLQLLKQLKHIKVVFFLDEEIGCQGSNQANFDFFSDSTIVLECDRKGYHDFVNNISGYDLYDKTLQNDIKNILTKYRRREVVGGMTDVSIIAQKTDVQVANMSCGYYNPHSDEEFIVIDEVYQTLKMCKEILDKTKNKMYRMKRENIYENYGFIDDYYDNACPVCNTRTLLDDFEDERFCTNCMDYVRNLNEDINMRLVNNDQDKNYNNYNLKPYGSW